MNVEQSLAPSQLNPAPPKPKHKVHSFLQKQIVSTIIVSTLINLGLIGTATWRVWDTSEHLDATLKSSEIQGGDRLTNLNEIQKGRQALSQASILTLISFGLLIASGSFISIVVRSYIFDREQEIGRAHV